MKVFVYRSGEIGFGPCVPEGALGVAEGTEQAVRTAVAGLARRSYDNTALLVTGIPENQEDDGKALDALNKFRILVQKALK